MTCEPASIGVSLSVHMKVGANIGMKRLLGGAPALKLAAALEGLSIGVSLKVHLRVGMIIGMKR